jgi:hypothetical protein
MAGTPRPQVADILLGQNWEFLLKKNKHSHPTVFERKVLG